jgi:L-2-hydroxyglutarate oxidase LhgO
VAGKHLLYEYCAAHGVPHRRCGKLIVATDQAQLHELSGIREKAHANGVTDVDWITKEEVAKMEPELFCVGALHSPSTGIIDSHALMLAYLGDAEAHGAMLALKTPLLGGEVGAGGIVLHTNEMTLQTSVLVNSAGLRAPSVAKSIEGYPRAMAPGEFYAKGNYYSLTRRSPFSRLVYPVPEPGGLGVHVTLDMGGQARFGPDVEWVDHIDYEVDPARAERFYPAIRKYWPTLPDGALMPSYSGMRPKIVPPAVASQDFLIQGPKEHGVDGLINLFGIESPGLTSSLAIADYVAELASA